MVPWQTTMVPILIASVIATNIGVEVGQTTDVEPELVTAVQQELTRVILERTGRRVVSDGSHTETLTLTFVGGLTKVELHVARAVNGQPSKSWSERGPLERAGWTWVLHRVVTYLYGTSSTPTSVAPLPVQRSNTMPWVLAGTGLSLAGVAVGFGIDAARTQSTLASGPFVMGSRVDGLVERRNRDYVVSGALTVGAVVAIAGALYLVLAD